MSSVAGVLWVMPKRTGNGAATVSAETLSKPESRMKPAARRR